VYTLFVRETFAAAHRIELYHGKCEELHGHNFRVDALFEGHNVGEEGMLIDFAVLKAMLRRIVADLDHKYINDIPFFKETASSSECLAFYIYGRLAEAAAKENVAVKEVRVWESDSAYAAYRE
jgi:6-pyruvoyltetrahydropterin/6-carboxytetrahydropterin synthase